MREPLATLAGQLNDARDSLQILAVDIPSGIDADTGATPGTVVSADCTVTLGGVKQGLLRFPAAQSVGKLDRREIGIPDRPRRICRTQFSTSCRLARWCRRGRSRHTSTASGASWWSPGADHFLGAPVLCAGGAARSGAGLVTLASTRDVRLNTAAHLPEVTFTESDIVSSDGAPAASLLAAQLGAASSVVVGPGLGRGPGMTAFVHEILAAAASRATAGGRRGRAVRPGGDRGLAEAARAQRRAHAALGRARAPGRASELSPTSRSGCTAAPARESGEVVLIAKGPFTCVAAPDGRVDVWPRANPALATGGTGDVLAGICAGLLAQGASAWDAARLAVGVHGLAAERVVQGRQWRTLLASDLLSELPAALEALARPTRPR